MYKQSELATNPDIGTNPDVTMHSYESVCETVSGPRHLYVNALNSIKIYMGDIYCGLILFFHWRFPWR